jgi:hypothetical protein
LIRSPASVYTDWPTLDRVVAQVSAEANQRLAATA